MAKCTSNSYIFPTQNGKKIVANFKGGLISSDGGSIWLKMMDDKIGLLSEVAKKMTDSRDSAKTKHSMLDMLKQRVFGLALGYEDLNDHDKLRSDIALQTSLGREVPLASSATLCRFENRANKQLAFDIHKVLLDNFIKSFDTPPEEIILDFDATDDVIHGTQIGKIFHPYYGSYCFLPLYVFCGQQLLIAYLQSNHDAAKQAGAILKLLVQRIREEWPSVHIILRGDCAFNKQTMLNWCDKNKVGYIVGMPKNSILLEWLAETMKLAKKGFQDTEKKQVLFTRFIYAAKSWGEKKKKIIAKAEHTEHGPNPRFIVTNLPGKSKELYQKVYCARGDMENRIKEQQMCLFADRTSCHEWWPNQLRLLLTTLAYTIIERFRATVLKGTFLESARVDTIRLKLFKIGAVLIKNTRSIYFMLASNYPYRDIFDVIYKKLVPT